MNEKVSPISVSKAESRSYALEETPCPLCGDREHAVCRHAPDRLGTTKDVFTFVRCSECGLVYQNPRVTPATIGVFYPSDYAHYAPTRAQSRRHISATDRIVERKCRFVEERVKGPGCVLELGSANGDFLAGMRQRGWEVHGVEVSAEGVVATRKQHGLEVFCGELLQRPDDGRRFDIIVSWAVLPHIHNPVATMRRATELLSPGGRTITLCANIASVASTICGNGWGHLDLPRHYTMWCPSTLSLLYQKAGLEVLEIVHHDDIYDSMLVFNWVKRIAERSARTPASIIPKVLRFGAWRANKLLTWPIQVYARRQKRGGIVTITGRRA